MRTDVRLELLQAKKNLDRTKKYSDEALEEANKVYDASLSLYANVSSLVTPDIDVNQLNMDATNANQNV